MFVFSICEIHPSRGNTANYDECNLLTITIRSFIARCTDTGIVIDSIRTCSSILAWIRSTLLDFSCRCESITHQWNILLKALHVSFIMTKSNDWIKTDWIETDIFAPNIHNTPSILARSRRSLISIF